MTEERLRELDKLHNASYPGEWTYDAQDMFVCHKHVGGPGLFMIATCDKDDGEAIAAAHNAMPDLLAEIRRLQAELTDVQIDRNNYELLNRLKIVTIEKHEAELARLRPVYENASKFVEAVNADSFEDGALYKALNDAVSQWTPSKAKEADHERDSVIKCPVCDGTGLVSSPPWVAGDVQTLITSSTTAYPCRVCGRGGVIVVTDIHPLESIVSKHYCPHCGAKLEAPTE